jgi:hypothetical protein
MTYKINQSTWEIVGEDGTTIAYIDKRPHKYFIDIREHSFTLDELDMFVEMLREFAGSEKKRSEKEDIMRKVEEQVLKKLSTQEVRND